LDVPNKLSKLKGYSPIHGISFESCTHIRHTWFTASFRVFTLIVMYGCLYFTTGFGERKFGMEPTVSSGLILRREVARNW
jgi:hypothetical protein